MTEEPGISPSEQTPAAGVTRRWFLEWMLGTLAGLSLLSVVAAALAYLEPVGEGGSDKGPVEVAKEEEIPVGEGRVVSYKGAAALVIHTEKRFVAFSAVCTHAQCIVEYQKKERRIYCPCHAGAFDLMGNVVSGPPPKPLPRYQVAVRGGKILLGEA